MAPPVITCYLTLISPFTYLGQPRLMELAARTGARVDYRPINIMALFEAVGATPPARRSDAHKRYRSLELARWSRRLGMPLNLTPAHWPVPANLASGVVITAQEQGVDVGPLVLGFLRAVWAENRDITDPGVVAGVADAVGLDGAILLAEAERSDAAARYARNTTDAIAAGCIGAPTYLVGGEMFWGQDRLDLVAEALETR